MGAGFAAALSLSDVEGGVVGLSGRDETGVRRSACLAGIGAGVVEELATGADSGSTIVMGTRRLLGGDGAEEGSGVDTSIGFLCTLLAIVTRRSTR